MQDPGEGGSAVVSGLLALAASLAPRKGSVRLWPGAPDQPIRGRIDDRCIYAVSFANGDVWSFRLAPPLRENDETEEPYDIPTTCEANALINLEVDGFDWSPLMMEFSDTNDNPVGRPFVAATWIHGKPLIWTGSSPVEQGQREKIIRQLIDIQLDLVERTKYRCNFATAISHYFNTVIDPRVDFTRDPPSTWTETRDWVIHKLLTQYCMHPEFDHEFAYRHGGLGLAVAPHNIIVDDDFNIKGIVDWKLSRVCPASMALRYPQLLALPTRALPNKDSQVIPQPSPVLAADRDMAMSHLRELATQDTPLASRARAMLKVCSDRAVDWQDVLLIACRDTSLHEWLVKRDWLVKGLTTDSKGDVEMPAEDLVSQKTEDLTCKRKRQGCKPESIGY